MNKSFYFAFLFILAGLTTTHAQQVGTGYATTLDSFNSILNTGIYDSQSAQTNYPYEIPQWPWKYLFVMRHSNSSLNYQFQLSSTFEHDDRVFFRKLAHLTTDTDYNNNWQEFATRGKNLFNGEQTVNGDMHLNGNQFVNQWLFIPTNRALVIGDGTRPDRSLRITYVGDNQRGDSYINYAEDLYFCNSSNSNIPFMVLSRNANVGIGTTNPQNKLEVNGTIRAKEIKVDSDWADFVFKKEYKLPALGEVKRHIEEKGTLPGVPSESDVKKNGVNLGEVNAILLQKVEELTLYVIKLQEEVNELKVQKDK